MAGARRRSADSRATGRGTLQTAGLQWLSHAWIRDPRAIDAKTATPNTGVTVDDARDIAAFLYFSE